MTQTTARSLAALLAATVLSLACGGADRATKKNMLEWAEALQFHLATTQELAFPRRLGDVEPALRSHLSRTDAWGTELLYRRWAENRYDLISAGPDGQFGNEDDIAVMKGKLEDAMQIYAERPLQASEIP